MAKQTLGFLDLPLEIRLGIYEILLRDDTAGYCEMPSDDGHDNSDPKCDGYRMYYEPLGSFHVMSNAGNCGHLSPETIKATTDVHPAILATCKTIAREAAPVLYGSPRFLFRLQSIFLCRLACPSRRTKAVGKLYDYYSADHDQWHYRTPHALANCQFAAFLRRIGRTNASLLSSIRFISRDALEIEMGMPVVTELVLQHCPGLRNLSVHLGDMVYWRASPERCHPDENSPFWMYGEFRAIVEQLERFVADVTWLRSFEYTGERWFPDAHDAIAGLTELVATRWTAAEREARAKKTEDWCEGSRAS